MVTDVARALPAGLLVDKRADETLAKFSTFLEGATVIINRMPTMEDRQILSARHKAVESVLAAISTQGADFSEAKRLLAQFFLGYPSLLNADAPGLVTAYVSDLRSLPLFAVRQALDDIKHGRVMVSDGHGRQMALDKDWPPSSTRVYDIAVKISDRNWREFAKLNQVLGTVQLCQPEITQAERERVGAKIKMMATSFKKSVIDDTGTIVDATQEAVLRLQQRRERYKADREAEYRANGLDPIYADEGKTIIMSLAFMLTMGHRIERTDGAARLVGPTAARV